MYENADGKTNILELKKLLIELAQQDKKAAKAVAELMTKNAAIYSPIIGGTLKYIV